MVNISELNSCKISNKLLVVHSNAWSEDNVIATITEKGLHITEFTPNFLSPSPTIAVHRSFLEAPQGCPLSEVGTSLKELSDSLPSEDRMQILMDTRLINILGKTSEMKAVAKQVAWAPQCLLRCRRCIMAVLTDFGCLQLFIKNLNEWQVILDISLLWTQMCNREESEEPEQNEFNKILERAKLLKITAFTWCTTLQCEIQKLAFVICSHESGHLSIWRIKEESSITASLEFVYDTRPSSRIEVLNWFFVTPYTGWLSVATSEGVVRMFLMTHNYECENIEINPLCELESDNDRMVPTAISLRKRSDNTILFAMNKGSFLVVYILSLAGKMLSKTFCHFAEILVSGVEVMEDNVILVITHTGNMYECTVQLQQDKRINFKTKAMDFQSDFNLKGYASFGMSFSRNKMLCILPFSMVSNYDHLALREPALLMICSCYSSAEMPSKQIQSLMCCDRFTFYQIHDCLEVIRIYLKEEDKNLSMEFVEHWQLLVDDDLKSTRVRLQVAYWCVRFSRLKEINSEAIDQTNLIQILEVMLVLCYLLNGDARVASERQQYLTSIWISAAIEMIGDACPHITSLSRSYVAQFGNITHTEKCEICQADVNILHNLEYLECVKGHRMTRCFASFLPVGKDQCLNCRNCGSLVRKCEGMYHCIFCDGILCISC